MKTKIAPTLTEWLGPGHPLDEERVITMRRELRSLKAVAIAAAALGVRDTPGAPILERKLMRALARLRGPKGTK